MEPQYIANYVDAHVRMQRSWECPEGTQVSYSAHTPSWHTLTGLGGNFLPTAPRAYDAEHEAYPLVSPTSITLIQDGPDPVCSSVHVRRTAYGWGWADWQAYSYEDWLALQPSSGWVPADVEICADGAGLPLGPNQGSMSIENVYGSSTTVGITLVVNLCLPLEELEIAGPTLLLPRETAVFSVSYSPFTVTPPITLSWDNGALGSSAAYSWTDLGSYTVTVTAFNACAELSRSLVVEVCQPVEALTISGPLALVMGQEGLYTATYYPPTATTPALVWDDGATGTTNIYSWTVPGTHSLSLQAINNCGQISTAASIEVDPIECIIPVEGGTCYSPPDRTRYTFPAGSFSDTVTLTHAARAELALPAPPTSTLAGIGHFFEVSAAYLSTGDPAEVISGTHYSITIGYSDREEGPTREETLALYFSEGVTWTQVGVSSTLDLVHNQVVAQVRQMGCYGLMGETCRIYLPLLARGW